MLDKMLKMQKGDTSVFEECFSYSCPKFISPIPPNYDTPPANSHLVSIILFFHFLQTYLIICEGTC